MNILSLHNWTNHFSSNMNTQNDWNALLRDAQKGDLEARNELCEKLRVRLRPVLKYRLLGLSTEDHQDIMQDTLVVFIEKMGNIKSNPHRYAFKILKNKIGNALQDRQKAIKIPIREDKEKRQGHAKRLDEEILTTGETEDDILDHLDRKIAVENILSAITKLSDFCRIFILAILEGRSVKDVWKLFRATEPNLQRSTFDKRTFDCRKKVRELAAD